MGINTDAVQRLYVAYFNRPADPVGLAYWEGQLSSTVVATQAQLEAIAGGFSGSAEYASLYAGQSNAQIIDTLYMNLFGRSAETAGLIHWAGQLASGAQTFAQIALQLTYSAQGTDATAIANKLAASTSFTTALDTNAEIIGYDGTAAAASARAWLADVTDVASTLTTATAGVATAVASAVSAGAAVAAAGTTYSLTTSADDVTGTSGNDTFIAAVGRLATDDRIDGGAGADTFCAALNSATVAPVISNVEQFNVEFRDGSASLDFADITGYTAIAIAGNTNGSLVNLGDAAKVTLNAYDDVVSIALDAGAASTANSVTLTIAGGSSGTFDISSAVSVETVNLVMAQSAYLSNTAKELDFGSAATTLNVSGSGNFTLVAGNMTAAADSLTTINASGLAGNLSVTLDTTNLNTAMNIVGGSGADTINFSATFASTDTVDGGAGTDSMTFVVNSTNTIRPNISNMETMSVTFLSAGQVDGRSAAGITTLNVDVDTTAGTFTRLQNVTAINVRSANDVGDNLSVTYQTGSDLDVTVNLGVATTASDVMTAGDLTIAGNNGAVSLVAAASGGVTLASGNFADATALTVSSTAQAFNILNITAATAQSVTFDVVKAQDIGTATFAVATTLTVNATGTAAAFSANTIAAAKLQSLTLNISGTDGDDVAIGSAAFGSAFHTLDITSTSTGSIFNLAKVTLDANAGADSLTINATMADGGTSVANFSAINIAASSHLTLDVTLAGSGSYDLVMGAGSSAQGTLVLDATGVSTAGKVSASLGALFAAASGSIEVSLGNGNGNYILAGQGDDTLNGGAGTDSLIGGAGDDSISGGAGSDTLVGGAGNDTIIAGAGANTIAFGTADYGTDTIELLASTAATAADVLAFTSALGSAVMGTDTVMYFRSGDSIVFAGITAVGSAIMATAQSGLGITAAFGSALVSAGGINLASAEAAYAIYSNGADTIIEVQVSSAAGVSGVERIVLEGVTFAGTALFSGQFSMSVNATAGLTFTLIA